MNFFSTFLTPLAELSCIWNFSSGVFLPSALCSNYSNYLQLSVPAGVNLAQISWLTYFCPAICHNWYRSIILWGWVGVEGYAYISNYFSVWLTGNRHVLDFTEWIKRKSGFEGSLSFTISACARILQILNTLNCSQHWTKLIACLHWLFLLLLRIQAPFCFAMIKVLQ